MLGELQKEKLTRMFRLWDTDGNSFIELEDWYRIVDRQATLLGIGEGTPEYERLRSVYTAYWEVLRESADTNRDERVSLEEFLSYWENQITGVEEVSFAQLPAPVQAICVAVIESMDLDHDGRISFDDYSKWLSGWRGRDAESDAKEAFQRLDRDGEGSIPRKNAEQNGAEFLLSNDPKAPGNWMLG